LHEVKTVETETPETVFDFFTPKPLQGRRATQWLQMMSIDFALVILNWLVVGAALVPLRVLFPQRRLFEFAAGAPISLLGFAILHASLITLLAYTEGLHASVCEFRIQVRIICKSVLLATVLMSLAYRLQGARWTISILFCGAGILHVVALGFWRRERSGLQEGYGDRKNVLIIGAGATGRRVASYLEQHPAEGLRVCGFLDDDTPLGNGVVGRISDLAQIARKGFVDEVLLAAPKDEELARRSLREARRLRLDLGIVPELFGCSPVDRDIERVGEMPVIGLHVERLPTANLALKRLTDIAGASVVLAVLSPLIALIALLIKFDSPGSVLYSAQRAGRKGRLFRCHKFRTMVSNADALKESLRQKNRRSGPFFKVTGDPRITRVGRLLRRFSLDELPQLVNVLKGEMSLVGPRPHPLDDVAGYELEHLARLDVTPGITGLWQVTARRDPSFQRGMDLDREYIRTWSLGLDLRILLRTVLAVVDGSGE
jgi:exopolysaccharide biosynthesis polyprenyl glycosylphosphotransferase